MLHIAWQMTWRHEYMTPSRSNYLRTHRKRCGFTQRELGFLVGLDSGQIISRYEAYSLVPHLRTALACQIIFDEVPHKLFPGMYREVEQSITERITQLSEELGDCAPTPVILQKQDCLQNVLERIEARNSNV